ncbi:MAG: hypothetical protein J0L93_09260 [Deltaproteobacteria bacterium]|nr:hypothetical protein [Deltaproteobacteria bacterium]
MKTKSLISLFILSISLTACGNSKLADSFKFKYDNENKLANIDIVLGADTEVHPAGETLLPQDLGKLFVKNPDASGKGQLSFEIDADRLEDIVREIFESQSKVASMMTDDSKQSDVFKITDLLNLPNGAPFPYAVGEKLQKMPVIDTPDARISTVFKIQKELYLGALLQFPAIREGKIPPSFSVCQNFKDKKAEYISAICFFAPTETEFGGLFIVANFKDLVKDVLPEGSKSSATEIASITSDNIFYCKEGKAGIEKAFSVLRSSRK